MNEIKNFNETLNCSYNQKDRYKHWTSYRDKLTDVIDNSSILNKDVLIIGAGNLNDIDIRDLSNRAKKVTLLDIDANSIIEGLKKYNLSQDRFDIIGLDLTELDQTDFIKRFEVSVINDETDEFFNDYENHKLGFHLDKFDIIIILPIYTQILFHQMLTVINQNSAAGSEKLINKTLTFVGNLIGSINSKLNDSLREDGLLIALSDVLEYLSDSKDVEFLKTNINNKQVVENFYEDYLTKYGYSLGSYGLHDLEMKMDLVSDKFLIWEFDENRKFLVKLLQLKRRVSDFKF